MDKEVYQRAYIDALEHVLIIFNRLFLKKKLHESCKNCKFVEEIEKLRLLIRDKQFEQIEQEIGYILC